MAVFTRIQCIFQLLLMLSSDSVCDGCRNEEQSHLLCTEQPHLLKAAVVYHEPRERIVCLRSDSFLSSLLVWERLADRLALIDENFASAG